MQLENIYIDIVGCNLSYAYSFCLSLPAWYLNGNFLEKYFCDLKHKMKRYIKEYSAQIF